MDKFCAILICLVSLITTPAYSRPVEVLESTVERSHFADIIEALGTTKAIETAVITADTTEKIVNIHFHDGQQVKKGQLLVSLNAAEETAQLLAASGELIEAQTSLARAEQLLETKALSEATLQKRKALLKRAQGNVDALKARISDLRISAPFGGVLGLREVSVGTLVKPGDVITTIDDLSKIRVDFSVPAVLLDELQPGQKIIGHVDAFPKQEFTGSIQTINTQVDPSTRTVKVRAILPNKSGILKPGLLMEVTLYRNSREALLIPEEALIKYGDKNTVFKIVKKDTSFYAQQVSITIGSRKPGYIEVLSGLTAGDKIVAHGVLKINDGTELIIGGDIGKGTPISKLIELKR